MDHFKKSGPLTSQTLEAMAYVKSDPSLKKPDIQIHFVAAGGYSASESKKPNRYGLEPVPEHARSTSAMTILPTLIYPKSRGSIHIKSKDITVYPEINPIYLKEKEDMDLLLKGIKIGEKIGMQDQFKEFRGKRNLHAYTEYKHGTDEYFTEEIKQRCINVYHYSGTCKMGVDDMSVCTPELKVIGIEGLRVADCSIQPNIVGANTNAVAIMIGEKCADMIKTEWNNKK